MRLQSRASAPIHMSVSCFCSEQPLVMMGAFITAHRIRAGHGRPAHGSQKKSGQQGRVVRLTWAHTRMPQSPHGTLGALRLLHFIYSMQHFHAYLLPGSRAALHARTELSELRRMRAHAIKLQCSSFAATMVFRQKHCVTVQAVRRAYDMATIRCKGMDNAVTNFPKEGYAHEAFMQVRHGSYLW